jgi:hypothetical protein
MSALRVREVRHLLDEPARFRRVVVLHGRLEMLAKRDGLTELPPEPAQQADAGRRDRHLRGQTDEQAVALELDAPADRVDDAAGD